MLAGPQLCFDHTCFNIEIADNAQTRAQGLMFRHNLNRNAGMLFMFDIEGIYPFWMKNTLIPLDIIWLDKDKKIVDIKTALPCTHDPCPSLANSEQALYVLEINAGLSAKLNLHKGDTFTLKY